MKESDRTEGSEALRPSIISPEGGSPRGKQKKPSIAASAALANASAGNAASAANA
jgi:hypothetical protein